MRFKSYKNSFVIGLMKIADELDVRDSYIKRLYTKEI